MVPVELCERSTVGRHQIQRTCSGGIWSAAHYLNIIVIIPWLVKIARFDTHWLLDHVNLNISRVIRQEQHTFAIFRLDQWNLAQSFVVREQPPAMDVKGIASCLPRDPPDLKENILMLKTIRCL
jgi:hypothetical protein